MPEGTRPGGESRVCANCNVGFTIEPEDFAFYERMKVPAPTFCPECRMKRRMNWRNERTLYKRKCGAPGHNEEVISVFSPEKRYVVYDQAAWWSDAWDPQASARDIDFSKPFFAQFGELLASTPLIAVVNGTATRTEYANHAYDSKDCYLVTAALRNENVLYSNRTSNNRDSSDLYLCEKMEGCYEDVNCGTSYRLFFSAFSEDCRDSSFLYDCRNCDHCIGCVGLRNKSYHIFNEPYSKEEFERRAGEFDLGSRKAIEELREKQRALMASFPRKYMYSFKTVDVTGDIVGEAKNCRYCFDVVGLQDSKFSVWGGFNMKDSYDGYGMGDSADLLYEVVDVGIQASNVRFSVVVWGCHDVQYSYNCHASSHLFGCVGLRNKQYCILNRQYSKEEYEALVPKLVAHMDTVPYIDARGRSHGYGEFFPAELSPFAYNETVAQEYFPVTQAEAEKEGYRWNGADAKRHAATMESAQLPENISQAEADAVTGAIVSCLHGGACNHQCSGAFRIIPDEFAFLKKMNIALPRLCPNCRHYERLAQRNPLRLWHGKCACKGTASADGKHANAVAHFHGKDACPNEFETSYAPGRPEIVYCETCYQQEVM